MLHILIVDDDPALCLQLKKMLEKEAFRVSIAMDGGEGKALFDELQPDITISDIKMPVVDGMALLRHIKATAPDKQVILITAHSDYDLAVEALREGALDYLRKPIDFNELYNALERAHNELAKTSEMCPRPNVVLLLDDDDMARDKFEKLLVKEGYDVIAAADGEAGLQIFSETKIDVVLTDLKMPKKGGLDVLTEVKQSTDDVEVILFTGYGDEETAIAAMRQGALSYLRKPVDIDQLLDEVESACDKLSRRRSMSSTRQDLQRWLTQMKKRETS